MITERRNVPMKYATNLCKQGPVIPSKCNVPHGMLMNLQGQGVSSLYTSSVLVHRYDEYGPSLIQKSHWPSLIRKSHWLSLIQKSHCSCLGRV